MKIYCISIMAFMAKKDANGLDYTYVEHIPALQPAESIKAAAGYSKNYALDRWQESEGWYGHQACIMPVTETFYIAYENAKNAGVLDSNDNEDPDCFQFDSGLDSEFLG